MAILVLCSTMMGMHFAEKSKEKLIVCNQLIHLCDLLIIDFGYTLTPSTLLIEKLLCDDSLNYLTFISKENVRSHKSINSCLTESENAKISDFLYSLGKTDVKGQIKLVESFKEYILICRNKYLESYNKNHKLYFSFGFFGGLALSLILA